MAVLLKPNKNCHLWSPEGKLGQLPYWTNPLNPPVAPPQRKLRKLEIEAEDGHGLWRCGPALKMEQWIQRGLDMFGPKYLKMSLMILSFLYDFTIEMIRFSMILYEHISNLLLHPLWGYRTPATATPPWWNRRCCGRRWLCSFRLGRRWNVFGFLGAGKLGVERLGRTLSSSMAAATLCQQDSKVISSIFYVLQHLVTSVTDRYL